MTRIPRRRTTLGQSFTTCLLFVVLFFGGIGTYYFKVFRWRDLEDPHRDLLIVKKDDNAELAFFRKKTVPDIIDPAIQVQKRLVSLRKESKKGTVVPENNAQECKEIGNRLIDIMEVAKLRQIPKQYAKKYENDVLVGISELYRSWLAYQEALDNEIPADKTRLIDESIKWSKSANVKLQSGRNMFLVK